MDGLCGARRLGPVALVLPSSLDIYLVTWCYDMTVGTAGEAEADLLNSGLSCSLGGLLKAW